MPPDWTPTPPIDLGTTAADVCKAVVGCDGVCDSGKVVGGCDHKCGSTAVTGCDRVCGSGVTRAVGGCENLCGKQCWA